MRAALLRGVGEALEARDDLELGGPGAGEVRVRWAATGLATRISAVVRVGDGVTTLADGDDVISRRTDLGDIDEAFCTMERGEVIRTVVGLG